MRFINLYDYSTISLEPGGIYKYTAKWESDHVLTVDELERRLRGEEMKSITITASELATNCSSKYPNSYDVKRIIFNDPATIVFWKDGTKTVVKCMEDTPFNPYYGFVCALAKKVYGSNSLISRIVDKYTEE